MATQFYLTAAPAPYSPATMRGAWDDTAGAITKALSSDKAGGGAIASVARAETNAAANWDVLLYRGVSGPLAAQTIAGNVNVVIGALESSASADFAWHLHIYVTQGDSDTPRGTLLSDYVETTANEWPTTAAGLVLAADQALTSLAVTAGDRLVVEIGYVALNASATSFTGTLRYGTLDPTLLTPAPDLTNGSTSVTTQAGYVDFLSGVTESPVGTRESSIGAVVASQDGSIRLSSMGVVVATPTSSAIRLSMMGVVIARRSKDTVFTLDGSYAGTDEFGPSSGSGTLTVRR